MKYASAFYGPFREAADSAPAFGDRWRRGREFCKILRDRKKIVDASLKMKREKGILVGSTEATQVVEHEKRKPTLKHCKNDSLGNSKFVANC